MYHPRLKGNHYNMGFHYGELLNKAGVSSRIALNSLASR